VSELGEVKLIIGCDILYSRESDQNNWVPWRG
jgi:hypothetical protein